MQTTLNDYMLSCELLGHSADVRCVASADNGQSILSGSRDKTLKVWKQNGKDYSESVTLKDHDNFISSVYYLASEKWICTGSNDAKICIYMEGSFLPTVILNGHESTVCSIARGIEERSIISGSWDKTARIWTINESNEYKSTILRGHEAAVWAVECNLISRRYITGSADKNIIYWDELGNKQKVLTGHTDCVRGIVSLRKDLLMSCANDAQIRCWNGDGHCVKEFSGHNNYIYGIATNRAIGDHVIVTCGEDSTLRMWNVDTGKEMGEAIVHPAQSVWCVTCLSNGDIVTGCSDGTVRVFTKDPSRIAPPAILNGFKVSVANAVAMMNENFGGMKKSDLPGPEALLTSGTHNGQIKMVRHVDGSVKCYTWNDNGWDLVGDVTGAIGGSQATSGKVLYEGKEYDYVFSVDISDTSPPIKLPYNRGEDPWQAAQVFIDKNELPQGYLDQVANFIIKNSSAANKDATAHAKYRDPFTGGSSYVPGTNGNDNNTNIKQITEAERHFPVNTYLTFDNFDSNKILDKLREFNEKLNNTNEHVSEVVLKAVVKLVDANKEFDKTAVEAIEHLLSWPSDLIFPVLDVIRLAVRSETIFYVLNSFHFLDSAMLKFSCSVANQLMIVRCLVNMMRHEAGRKHVCSRLPALTEQIMDITSGSANLQIAIATFYLNATISQMMIMASQRDCYVIADGVIGLLKWADDLEATYRAMQSIGNLILTPYGDETKAKVSSANDVVDKVRKLSNASLPVPFAKVNSLAIALLAAII